MVSETTVSEHAYPPGALTLLSVLRSLDYSVLSEKIGWNAAARVQLGSEPMTDLIVSAYAAGVNPADLFRPGRDLLDGRVLRERILNELL